jgi:hypothetical protein
MSALSTRGWRNVAAAFFALSVALTASLVWSWRYFYRMADSALPEPPPLAQVMANDTTSASPLLVDYHLDVPGRGEIFPALASEDGNTWPLAVLTLTNSGDRPSVQVVSAEVNGWTTKLQQTLVLAPHEARKLPLNPELLPAAYENAEMRRAILQVKAQTAWSDSGFSKNVPVYLHSAFDLYWGDKFSNAQFVARWVTPHDPAILGLVSSARAYLPAGRMPGYGTQRLTPKAEATQSERQARAVFEAFRRTGISYVSSIFTFGNFSGTTERIRLPGETLALHTANCIDVSVAYASAIENIGMKPVIVIVPGHAFVGVRLSPTSQETLYLDLTVLPRGSFWQAKQRASGWLKQTPSNQVLMVDIAAARALGIYPMPTELAGLSSYLNAGGENNARPTATR